MLKWAVNGTRQSYLPSIGENSSFSDGGALSNRTRRSMSSVGVATTNIASPAQRKHRRKSSDITSSLRYNLRSGNNCNNNKNNKNNNNKENCLTSTPLAISHSLRRNNNSNSPHLVKLGSLRDLSNIPCDSSPLHTNQKDETESSNQPLPQYASTLPTFDVEYSPCALVPGPILALRGIGIADTYFEKPRYLSHEFKEINRKEEKFVPHECSIAATTPSVNKWSNVKTLHDEDSSLSSSRMGDRTLERMIDAILESARKERKIPKNSKNTAFRAPIVMSPTYTPAEDPASDLHEFWDAQTAKYQQHSGKMRSANQLLDAFNEREVRSPIAGQKCSNEEEISFNLRRQRAVRRKRKFSEIKSSAQEQTATTTQIDDPSSKRHCNISPDSGRNSFSELEDSTLDGIGDGSGRNKTIGGAAANCTKRRLSFSINNLGDI